MVDIQDLGNFSEFLLTMSRFFEGNRPHCDRDLPGKRQHNGRAVTVTVAPLQFGTVFAEHKAQIIFFFILFNENSYFAPQATLK